MHCGIAEREIISLVAWNLPLLNTLMHEQLTSCIKSRFVIKEIFTSLGEETRMHLSRFAFASNYPARGKENLNNCR